MNFLAAQVRHLTGDESKLLILLTHHMGERGCFPSQETLMEETGWSQRKVRRIRDALAAKGAIGFVAGTGRESTRYVIPGLLAHETASRVPESAVEGLPPGGTEHLNKEIEKKPVLTIVREGWPSLVHQAPDLQREHWLKHLVFDGRDADGTIRLTAPNTLIQTTVKKMFGEDPAIISLARRHGIDPGRVEIRSAKKPGADLPKQESRVRDSEPGGHDYKRSMGRQFEQNMNRAADRFEADDGPAVQPSRPHNIKVTDLAAYRTKLRNNTDLGKED